MPVGYILRTANENLYFFEGSIETTPARELTDAEKTRWADKIGAGWMDAPTFAEMNAPDDPIQNRAQFFKVEFEFEDGDEVVPISGNGSYKG